MPDQRLDGLTAEEGFVADALFEAFNDYLELPVQHDDEPNEFKYHIHMLQGLMAIRAARRAYPAGWHFDGSWMQVCRLASHCWRCTRCRIRWRFRR